MRGWQLAVLITLGSWFFLALAWSTAGVPQNGPDLAACVFTNVVLGLFVPFVAFRYLED